MFDKFFDRFKNSRSGDPSIPHQVSTALSLLESDDGNTQAKGRQMLVNYLEALQANLAASKRVKDQIEAHHDTTNMQNTIKRNEDKIAAVVAHLDKQIDFTTGITLVDGEDLNNLLAMRTAIQNGQFDKKREGDDTESGDDEDPSKLTDKEIWDRFLPENPIIEGELGKDEVTRKIKAMSVREFKEFKKTVADLTKGAKPLINLLPRYDASTAVAESSKLIASTYVLAGGNEQERKDYAMGYAIGIEIINSISKLGVANYVKEFNSAYSGTGDAIKQYIEGVGGMPTLQEAMNQSDPKRDDLLEAAYLDNTALLGNKYIKAFEAAKKTEVDL